MLDVVVIKGYIKLFYCVINKKIVVVVIVGFIEGSIIVKKIFIFLVLFKWVVLISFVGKVKKFWCNKKIVNGKYSCGIISVKYVLSKLKFDISWKSGMSVVWYGIIIDNKSVVKIVLWFLNLNLDNVYVVVE